MAKALAQSRRRILPFLTPSRMWLEQPLEPTSWLLKLEANSPNITCVRLFSVQASPPAQARQMVWYYAPNSGLVSSSAFS
ncbi:UNVERIFIED_CONTAM: hypothetical protein Sradi_4762000 [Sesamum radiatum]|uniref:Uncharacterized protein n=1 Tax=Sesamum radiatum TaxID=300843 RepID=A0AAW2MZK2_SESRA